MKREEKGLKIEISGIVCDNPACDHQDMSVPFTDYPSYINKPCPKCGWNLLTQEDYDECVAQIEQGEKLNTFMSESPDALALMEAMENNPELMAQMQNLVEETFGPMKEHEDGNVSITIDKHPKLK